MPILNFIYVSNIFELRPKIEFNFPQFPFSDFQFLVYLLHVVLVSCGTSPLGGLGLPPFLLVEIVP